MIVDDDDDDDGDDDNNFFAESSTASGISPRSLVQQTLRTVSVVFFSLLQSYIRSSQSF